jgi:hypothetical protein
MQNKTYFALRYHIDIDPIPSQPHRTEFKGSYSLDFIVCGLDGVVNHFFLAIVKSLRIQAEAAPQTPNIRQYADG